MHVFHQETASDREAISLAAEASSAALAHGGVVSVSRSFDVPGSSAAVVLVLPDGVSPADAGLPNAVWVEDLGPLEEDVATEQYRSAERPAPAAAEETAGEENL